MSPVENAVKVLNEVFENDRQALHAIVCFKAAGDNPQFAADHPSVQYGTSIVDGTRPTLSVLGLINGLVSDGTEFVAMSWSEPDPETRACKWAWLRRRPRGRLLRSTSG